MSDAAQDGVKVGLLSVSDRASAGVYEDKGLPALQTWLARALRNPIEWDTRVIPDDEQGIDRAGRPPPLPPGADHGRYRPGAARRDA
jgi:molybdopterin adenylyltransferase